MKLLIFLVLLLGGLTSFASKANYPIKIVNKGVYGNDDREIVSESNKTLEKWKIEQSKSVLAQIPKWKIATEDKESISIFANDLVSELNFCPDEKFSDLPIVASCTAFLVGPDLILTAGHCVKNKDECFESYWALDYDERGEFEGPEAIISFKKENIYSCSKILSWSENPKLDYALIKLDRKILNRSPLKIRRTDKIDDTESLAIIGHPMGLPKIVADKAVIRSNSSIYTFVTNADTFSGNSGSPVINSKTHLVEGMIVRGGSDFKMDIDLGCNRVTKCLDNECKGETVLRTTVLPLKLIPKIKAVVIIATIFKQKRMEI
jgi:hypothetical protein